MTWSFEVTHIGGILDGDADLEPGLNAVKASNWQGKSSFIEAIKTALGVSKQLTEGKETGMVRYQSPNTEATVHLERNGDTVQRTGNPMLTDEYDVVRSRLFACLDETNEVRRRVREGENLQECLLRPLDFENIDRQIRDLKREREQVDTEISRATEAKERLPGVQEKVTQLENEIEELREEYETLQSEDMSEADSTTARNELAEAETARKQTETKISRLEKSIERTKSALETKRTELEELEVPEIENIAADLKGARKRRQELDRDKTVLESVHSSMEMVLRENRLDLVTDVTRELDADRLVCWTCGSDTSRSEIEEQLSEIRTRISEIKVEVEHERDRVESLEAKQERITQNRKRRETLEAEIEELEEKRSTDRESLENAENRLEGLREQIQSLSEKVDESLDQRTELESTLKYREAELQDVRNDLDELTQRADQLETLESQREEIADEIAQLRERKERIRTETREAFDSAIQDIVSRFETGFETARLTPEFELVVARGGREASLEALSEGELELLGFAAVLAGYRAFDVSEISPFILVDRVGGLAEHNLHTLVDYLRKETEYVVFTTYPEHRELDGHAIKPEKWKIAHA